ncbi:hypothetical protein COT72_01465 [archaeon CG10_big_fil_rev_8_21_14_0_10_43_11]|nr:MAG: hypothetical protein COT72_01465 [archaeon CG10_big_fil_rev_8_21_14_0_10_43_11]
MSRVIGIISGKGGVGKTTTSVNLSATLAHNFKRETVVVDTNVSSSNLSLHVGAHFHPLTINNALRGEVPIAETIVVHPSGMKVVPASLSVDDMFVECTNLPAVINELKADNEFIILDTAPSIGHETLNALKVCDDVIIVTTPDLPAVTDALKTIKLAEKLNVHILGVVVNMYQRGAPLTIKDVEYMLNYPIVGVVPFDTSVNASVMKKVPIVHYKPNSRAAQNFKKVASGLVGVDFLPEKGLFQKLLGIFIEE